MQLVLYVEIDEYFKVKSGKHIGVSPLTIKKTKLANKSFIMDHLLDCNNDSSFDKFGNLAHDNRSIYSN